MRLLLTALALMLASCGERAETFVVIDPYADERPISWQNLLDRPRQEATARIAYGEGAEQYGELWLPDADRFGEGPHPLVIMIHGGCWRAEIPGTILQDQLNADLRARGIALWNITYPRVGHESGGYPGTFQSVAQAVDHVRALEADYPLDLSRAVIMGHSAGGHLAAWAGARSKLDMGLLRTVEDTAFTPRAVITLAGINALQRFHESGPGRCGEPDIVEALIGFDTRAANPFSDTDPAALLPLGVEQVVISAELDPIVPAQLGVEYAALAAEAGDPVTEITLADAGHFELIDPTAPAWLTILSELERLLNEPR